jgi:hypothetical protein
MEPRGWHRRAGLVFTLPNASFAAWRAAPAQQKTAVGFARFESRARSQAKKSKRRQTAISVSSEVVRTGAAATPTKKATVETFHATPETGARKDFKRCFLD